MSIVLMMSKYKDMSQSISSNKYHHFPASSSSWLAEPVCGEPFLGDTSGTAHVKQKPGDENYQTKQQTSSNPVHKFSCGDCGMTFKFRSHLEIHHRIHTGIKPYVCEVCNKRFTQKNNLKTHFLTVHFPMAGDQ